MDLNPYQLPPQPDWCGTGCEVPHAHDQDAMSMDQPHETMVNEAMATGQANEAAACESASMDTGSESEKEEKTPIRKRQRRMSDTPEKWSEMIQKKLEKSKRTGQACDRCKASRWQDSILLLAALKLTLCPPSREESWDATRAPMAACIACHQANHAWSPIA